MENSIFLYPAIFCTCVFIFQFILSMIVGEIDTDADIDVDGDGDFSFGDLVSFKGIIHFGIGFCWTMWFYNGTAMNQWLVAIIAVTIGLAFVLILAGTYWLAMKLRHEVIPETGETLIGRPFEIYLPLGHGEYDVFTIINGAKRKITVRSMEGKVLYPGEHTEIIDFKNNIYYIH